MAKEIERKFLVDINAVGSLIGGQRIKQGYIETANKTVVRVRVIGEQAFLTLKGKNTGAVRSEFEYPIPLSDANAIMDELCTGPIIDKTRYCINVKQHVWELDIFYGDNLGLIVAEIELSDEKEDIVLPHWVISEVTGDEKYYNSNLLRYPFNSWVD